MGLVGGGVLCLAGAGLVVVLAVGAFLFWLYRLGTDEEDELESQVAWGAEDQANGGLDDQSFGELGAVDDSPAT